MCIDLINPFSHVLLLSSCIRPYCSPFYGFPFYFSLLTIKRRRTLSPLSTTGSPSRTYKRFSKFYSLSVPLNLSPSTRLAHSILVYNPSHQAIINHWDGPTFLYVSFSFLSVCVPSPQVFRYAHYDLLPRVLTFGSVPPALLSLIPSHLRTYLRGLTIYATVVRDSLRTIGWTSSFCAPAPFPSRIREQHVEWMAAFIGHRRAMCGFERKAVLSILSRDVDTKGKKSRWASDGYGISKRRSNTWPRSERGA